jgi:hypothetical protein
MNHQLLAATQTTEPTATPTQPTSVVPVEKVLAEIGRDSRRDSQQYLDESVTPYGGE